MCKSRNSKNVSLINKNMKTIRVDECLMLLIKTLSKDNYIKTLGCCCGHGKYPMTIIVKNNKGEIFDLMSNTPIPRKVRFYKKDEQGYYYIPELNEK